MERKEKKKRVQHVGSYEIGKTLGNGSFGKVKLGTNIFTKEKVAVKFIKENKLSSKQRETCMREIEIMKLMDHPNIVRLLDVVEKKEDKMSFLVVEYVSGGELFDYIVAREFIKEKEARKFFRQMISAIEYCHANLVVHRDLKPENLLLDSNGNIKISDFGLSNIIMPGKLMDSFCGSPLYAAPEILKAEKYLGPPVDIWSLGVILYAILCGSLPWEGDNQAEISYNSVHGNYADPTHLSKEAVHILRRMIQPSPKSRATLEELKMHRWTNTDYDTPPPSFLSIREPVYEIRDELMPHLMSLGFSDEQEVRKLILQNVQCRAVSIYHLLLDNLVQKEISEIKNNLIKKQQPKDDNQSKKLLKSALSLASIPEDEAGGGGSHQDSNNSSLCSSPSSAHSSGTHVNEMINSMAIDDNSYQISSSSPSKRRQSTPEGPSEGMKYVSLPSSLSAPASSPSQTHKQKQQRMVPHLQIPKGGVGGELQQENVSLSAREPFKAPATPTSHQDHPSRRRFSITGPPIREELQNEFLLDKATGVSSSSSPRGQDSKSFMNNYNFNNDHTQQQQQQQQQQYIQQQQQQYIQQQYMQQPFNQYHQHQQQFAPFGQQYNIQAQPFSSQSSQNQPIVEAPRTRRMSLDSRMMVDGADGPTEKNEHLASPRMTKGIFKSSTTTTKSPERTIEEVKKCLDQTNLFTKKKGPYIFICFDDETGVKFQIEIVKISAVNLTGVQLKRISGDTWKYKDICTEVVESIHI
ncbi:putative protein serine/threonine kinase [Cavenderia fasciculata]|uniref:non-specific serine/threonine protein kinase n=1 Tax=Cavenderia fasciculata TaxID=261658 RepID=F4Q4A3_CACFS|nr:putative protein serine/threonine kinase [Cavenderia fasciculata]EGG16965.1 putative protein serine/threonine kinase [Cavenderia fasciculata]|eukprot:XP_004355439.1 putative protein serine/threonine kinase [Cavenderia fasciculata]